MVFERLLSKLCRYVENCQNMEGGMYVVSSRLVGREWGFHFMMMMWCLKMDTYLFVVMLSVVKGDGLLIDE